MKIITKLLTKMGAALLLFYVARAIYLYLDLHLSFTQLFGLLLALAVVDKALGLIGATSIFKKEEEPKGMRNDKRSPRQN